MTHPLASTLLVPRDYESFAGLDVDKSILSVTFTDHVTLVWSLRMPYSSEHLLNYARKHFAGRKLAFAYEAGPTGFGLYDELAAEGHRCLGVAPQVVPTALGQPVKTNHLDSQKLSEGLRGRATEEHPHPLRAVPLAAASGRTARQPYAADKGG